jgi:hypothetical protein
MKLGKSELPIFYVFNRKIAVVPIDTTKAGGSSWVGADTLWFTVRDPGGLSQKKPVIFEKYNLKPIIIDTIFIPILPHLFTPSPLPGERGRGAPIGRGVGVR